MTLKFESEILFDLMKRDGDGAPSDVLPYESELKEKYLNQVVGAYPKLQDYRPEWLNYNLYHHLPSDFPTESVTNVTSASFHDVVPYAYKSAILKGNTDENLQSIKMPVLKTVGKNLFDGNIIGNYYVNNDGGLIANSECYATDFIEIKPNTNFSTNTRENEITAFYDEDKNFISYIQAKTFLSPSNARFLRTTIKPLSLLNTFQLEEGTTTTPYEPYKSIILTVNEPIELRGVGDVKDELDLLTGEVTERIGEYIYNGEIKPSYNNSIGGYVVTSGGGNANVGLSVGILSDKVKAQSFANNDTGVYGNMNGHFYIFDKTVSSADEFIDKYKGAVFQYHLVSPIVKTVDLTCINEHGENETLRPIEGTMHVNTSSQTLPPLLDMSVPVEATSQNLMSFANIVEEEK